MSPPSPLSSLLQQLSKLHGPDASSAMSLPPGCYVEPDFLALEVDRVFRGAWLCVGRAADIAEAGDQMSYESPVGPVMAVRQKDGSVKTLSRVCRHRAALVGSDGVGSSRLLVCPYHKWVYELDGQLRGAPGMAADFEREACRLPDYRTEIWAGFVFFNTDPDAGPLADKLAPHAARIARHDLEDLATRFVIDERWAANWKVAFENSCETYHHMGVHRQTLEPAFPTAGVVCEDGGPAFNLHSAPAAAGFSFERPHAQSLLNDDDLQRLTILGIYPNLVLAFSGPNVTWFRFTPQGPGACDLRVGWLGPASLTPDADALARERAILEAILAEDRVSCAGVQRGLSSLDAAPGPLSPLEATIGQFARYLAAKILASEGGQDD